MIQSPTGPLAWPAAGSGDRVGQAPHHTSPACGANPLSGQRPPQTQKASPTVANIKSQIKRIRTNEKARLRNQSVKSELKTYVRRVREAIEAGDKAAAEEHLRKACRKLDKAASKGIIHRNQAANRKSKLARRVAAL